MARCTHNWRKYYRPHNGVQQWRCTRCGKLKNRKVSPWAQVFCVHKWRLDRRMKPPKLRCKKCSKIKEAQRAR